MPRMLVRLLTHCALIRCAIVLCAWCMLGVGHGQFASADMPSATPKLRAEADLLRALSKQDCQIAEIVEPLKIGANPDVRMQDGESALCIAVSRGRIDLAKCLLEHGANPDARDADGNTSLLVAVKIDSPDIIRLLLKHGAHVNFANNACQKPFTYALTCMPLDTKCLDPLVSAGADMIDSTEPGSNYLTPLIHRLVRADSLDGVKYLLEHGADPNTIGYSGDRPLHVAVENDNVEMIKFLIAHKADPNATGYNRSPPLFKALLYHGLPVIRCLLDCGARFDKTLTTFAGEDALFSCRSVEAVNELLERGADVNDVSKFSRQPLLFRWITNCQEIQYLVAKKADIRATDGGGRTAMQEAADRNAMDTIVYLHSIGGDINAHSKGGWPPLFSACARDGNLPTVKCLETLGADMNVRDDNNNTALIVSAMCDCPNCVTYLLDRKAPVNAVTLQGRSALSMAASSGNEAMVRQLIAAGSVVDQRDIDKKTPLIHAVLGHDLRKVASRFGAIKALVENGSDVKAVDGSGRTALDYIKNIGADDVVAYLSQHGCTASTEEQIAQAADKEYLARQQANRAAELEAGKAREAECKAALAKSPQAFYKMLIDAVNNNDRAAFRSAVSHGVKIIYSNSDILAGKSEHPLEVAIKNRNSEFVKTLLDIGAVNTEPVSTGESPLRLAVRLQFPEIVTLILNDGAPVNSLSRSKRTVLMDAEANLDTTTMEVLLKAGAQTEIATDISGQTPFSEALVKAVITLIAARKQNSQVDAAAESGIVNQATRVLDLLLKYGANTETICGPKAPERQGGRRGLDPLTVSVDSGNVALVRYMIEHGAVSNTWISGGRMLIERATTGGHAEVADLLRQYGLPIVRQ